MSSLLRVDKPKHGRRRGPQPARHARPWSLRFLRTTGLRILCYHGVCADEVGHLPWVPSHFVTVSQFRQQMEMLSGRASVVHLPDVLPQIIHDADRLGPCFAITFDDVAACAFVHARPVLERLGIRASFYVATGHVTGGRLFCGDVARLLRCEAKCMQCTQRKAIDHLLTKADGYKRLTLEETRQTLAKARFMLDSRLDPTVREALRPMNWGEVAQLADEGHEVGAHTVDHVILGRQSPQVRREQITDSVLDLQRRLHTKVMGFAYPNGGPGDFGEPDRAVLRELGVRYALTTRPGLTGGSDAFSLPRTCVGLGHTRRRFALELTGLLDRRRRKQYGWR